jgi:hypothetical protein
MRRVALTAVLVLACSGALATVAAGQLVDDHARLQAAQAKWKAQHLRSYRFRLRVQCFCPDVARPMTIVVRGGRSTGARGSWRFLATVPRLFAQIRQALDDPEAGAVVAHYDARRGFPRSVSIDRIRSAIDDEISWTADRFAPLPRRHRSHTR